MFDGGLDFITPSITAAPGTFNGCLNFERTDRLGATRIFGYEKVDGGGNPSLAYTNLIYIQHEANLGTSPPRSALWINTVDVPKTILGYVVEATAEQTLIVITDFNEWRRVVAAVEDSGITLTDAFGDTFNVTSYSDFDSTYKAAQTDPDSITAKELTEARNDLFISMDATVTQPGSGDHPIIGSHGYKDQLYGIVDYDVLYFTDGNHELIAGDHIVPHDASDESNLIVVRKITLLSGSWAGSDATGIILTNQSSHASNGVWDAHYPSTTVESVITLATAPIDVDITPTDAGMWRTNNYNQAQAASEDEGWNPVDTGYEFDFTDGTNFGPPHLYVRGDLGSYTTPVLSSSAVATEGSTSDSTFAGDPVAGDTWVIESGFTIPEAVSIPADQEGHGNINRTINNSYSGPEYVIGNLYLTNFSNVSSFAASSGINIKGIQVDIDVQYALDDGTVRQASVAVQPVNTTTLVVTSTPETQIISYDPAAPIQARQRLTFGGPDSLFGLTADNMKAAMDDTFGFCVQPYINRVADNRNGSIFIFYVNVTVYYTADISSYYFYNGTDDLTAKIVNYNLASGTWEGNDAAGTMQVIDVTPVGSADRWAITDGDEIWTEPGGTGLHFATVSTNQITSTLPCLKDLEDNKSRYEIITANFYSNADWEAFYGVSGAGRAFSYDGFYFKRIYAIPDNTLDLPRHIAFHQFHLALGYLSGAVELSATGDPFNFNGVDGAVEIDMGDPVTGLIRMNGTTLGVFCKKSIQGIIGTSSDNFSRQILSPYEGAIEYTLVDMGQPVYCSYRGISTFDQTAAYGDFSGQRMSTQVNPWLLPRIQGTVSPLGETAASAGPIVAIPCRTTNQYRLYFGDGYRLTMTMVNGQQPQFTIQAEGLFSNTGDAGLFMGYIVPRSETSYVDGTGAERIYISHYSPSVAPPTSGYFMYEYNRSWTFDGHGIPAYFVSNENFYGSAFDYDKFNKIRLHGMSLGYAPISVHVETNYKENLDIVPNSRLIAPISLPRDASSSLSSDYKNTTNICNLASDGRSFNFRFMSYVTNSQSSQPNLYPDPVYAEVCPPFILQGMLVQTKEGKGDV